MLKILGIVFIALGIGFFIYAKSNGQNTGLTPYLAIGAGIGLLKIRK